MFTSISSISKHNQVQVYSITQQAIFQVCNQLHLETLQGPHLLLASDKISKINHLDSVELIQILKINLEQSPKAECFKASNRSQQWVEILCLANNLINLNKPPVYLQEFNSNNNLKILSRQEFLDNNSLNLLLKNHKERYSTSSLQLQEFLVKPKINSSLLNKLLFLPSLSKILVKACLANKINSKMLAKLSLINNLNSNNSPLLLF